MLFLRLVTVTAISVLFTAAMFSPLHDGATLRDEDTISLSVSCTAEPRLCPSAGTRYTVSPTPH